MRFTYLLLPLSALACVTVAPSPTCIADTGDGGLAAMPDAVRPLPTASPRATTHVQMAVQLSAVSGTPPTPAFDPTSPFTTSDYAAPIEVDDSLGRPHDVTIYFRDDGGGSHTWHAMVDGSELSGGTPGVPTEVESGALLCDTSGAITGLAPVEGTWDFLFAAPGQTISWSFAGVPVADGTWAHSRCGAYNAILGLAQDGQRW